MDPNIQTPKADGGGGEQGDSIILEGESGSDLPGKLAGCGMLLTAAPRPSPHAHSQVSANHAILNRRVTRDLSE